MNQKNKVSVYALALALCGSAANEARAAGPAVDAVADEEREQHARQAYERGRILFRAQEYEQAIEAFEEAAALFASPDFQYNLALCHERLQNFDAAVSHYKVYLATEDPSVDTRQTEARIGALQDLAVRKREREQADAVAERERIRLEAEAAANANVNKEPEPGPEVDSAPGRKKIVAGAALIGVGAAVGLGGGLGFGLAVGRNNQALDEATDPNAGNPSTFAEAQAVESRAQTNQTLELVSIGVGAAVVVGGTVVLALGLRERRERQVKVQPVAGPRHVGISVGGRF